MGRLFLISALLLPLLIARATAQISVGVEVLGVSFGGTSACSTCVFILWRPSAKDSSLRSPVSGCSILWRVQDIHCDRHRRRSRHRPVRRKHLLCLWHHSHRPGSVGAHYGGHPGKGWRTVLAELRVLATQSMLLKPLHVTVPCRCHPTSWHPAFRCAWLP